MQYIKLFGPPHSKILVSKIILTLELFKTYLEVNKESMITFFVKTIEDSVRLEEKWSHSINKDILKLVN